MNKQELIEEIKGLKYYNASKSPWVDRGLVLDLVEQLDKHEEGHADEAPRYVKNILARLRELPLHDREVWLKTIMGEFEQDFSRAKWREGYEQGKFEASMIPYEESQKVTVPQFVADWIEVCKEHLPISLHTAMDPNFMKQNNQSSDLMLWIEKSSNQEIFAQAWIFGYTVEKEKRYLVKIKGVDSRTNYLYYGVGSKTWLFKAKLIDGNFRKSHTRKELEQDNFGWVFDCPGIEIEVLE